MALENPSSMAPTMVRPAAARRRTTAPVLDPTRMPWWLWLVLAGSVLLAGAVFVRLAKPQQQPPDEPPGPTTSPGPVTPPQPGPLPVETAHTGLRAILDRLAKDPLRWAAAGAMPLPTTGELDAAMSEESDPNLRRLLDALRLVYAGDLDKARAAAEDAWGQAPKGDADAALVRGEVLLLDHRWTGQDKPLDDALEMFQGVASPEPLDVAVLRAVVLISKREEDRAEEACLALLERENGSARLHLLEALRHQGKGQIAKARQEVAKAKGLDPTLEDCGYDAFLGWFEAFDRRAWDGMSEQVLLEATKGRRWPLAHLLRAWVAVHRLDWEGAAEEMKEFERARTGLWPAIEPEELHLLAAARTVRARQAVAGVATFAWLGEWDEAEAAGARARELAGEGVDADGRKEMLRDLEFWLAVACAAKGDVAEGLAHAQAYLDHGGEKAYLDVRDNLKPLRGDPGWAALREK